MRCRASANLDGAIWTEVGTVGLPRPALQILADHPEFALTGADAVAAGIVTDPAWHDAERMLARDGWRNVDRLASPGHTARIAGSTHMSFMDIPFLAVRPGSPVAGMLAATSIRPERMSHSPVTCCWRSSPSTSMGSAIPWVDSPAPTNQRSPSAHRDRGRRVIDRPTGSACAQPVHRAGHTFVRRPGGGGVSGAQHAMRAGFGRAAVPLSTMANSLTRSDARPPAVWSVAGVDRAVKRRRFPATSVPPVAPAAWPARRS